MSGFRAISLGEKTLERPDGDGLVDFAAAAGRFAGVSADAAADARHGVGVARVTVRFFKAPLGNQRDVAPGVGPRRARHHARKVAVKPVAVDFLIPKSHSHNWFRR